jgi:enterochelin esterase family protein
VFRYNFTVDGVRVQDPKAPLSAEQSSLLTVGESYIKDVPHGAVAQRFYFSKTLGEMRRLHVWTPAGYEKSADKLPVLYLIHGGGDNDASWPGVGAAGWILDNLLAEGKIVPMVVVMPNGTINNVPNEVPPFAEDMVTSIIPFIEANYNVKTDADNRAMAGLSMGGMETIETAFNHPELFRYVWVLSASFAPGQDPAAESARLKVKENISKLNSFRKMVFTQGGPTDIAYQNCKNTRDQLDKDGLKYEYMENAQAGHSWTTWRADLQTLAPTLFR